MPAPARPNYLLLAALLVLAQLALLPLRSRGQARALPVDPALVPIMVGEWQGHPAQPLDQATLTMLRPDAYVHRLYVRPDGVSVDLTVIYGHHKSSFHSPAFCLVGGGWSIIAKGIVEAPAGGARGRPLRLNRLLLQKGDYRAVVLYCYVHRRRAITSWTALQTQLLYDRLRGGPGAGALVSLAMLAQGQGENADRIGLAFFGEIYPAVLRSMSADGAGSSRRDTDGSDVTSRGGGHQPGHRY